MSRSRRLATFAGLSLALAFPATQARAEQDTPQAKQEGKPDQNLNAKTSTGILRGKALERAIDEALEAYDMNPRPETPIPDDPPPHEGALIDLPLVIEPPDLVLIEVLEALPGRPISGERLVRPDGTISLGFYGEIHARGMTPAQLKVKVIKHLRSYLTHEVLGLIDRSNLDEPWPEQVPNPEVPQSSPPPDTNSSEIESKDGGKKPGRASAKKPVTSSRPRSRKALREYFDRPVLGGPRLDSPVRLIARHQADSAEQELKKQVKIPVEGAGRIEIDGSMEPVKPKESEVEVIPTEPEGRPVKPENSGSVFVEISAYNARNYYVTGDVAAPGILPWTGRETVFDVLNHAGGLLATAEPKDIRLVRPARGGKPARVFKVDYQAIVEKGDKTLNYQIFPGDRLVVGRNEVVKKTIELDRLMAPINDVIASIRQETAVLQGLQTLKNTSPDKQDAIIRELVEFWIKELKRPGGAAFDEETLRDALLRRLQIRPAPPTKPLNRPTGAGATPSPR